MNEAETRAEHIDSALAAVEAKPLDTPLTEGVGHEIRGMRMAAAVSLQKVVDELDGLMDECTAYLNRCRGIRCEVPDRLR